MKNNYPCKGTDLKGIYPIGLRFTSRRGKSSRESTLVDIYTTTNSKGEVVKKEYLTHHDLCGQIVSVLVPSATIALSTITGI